MKKKSNKILSITNISTYNEMVASAQNWNFACTFQLSTNAFNGKYTILTSENIELAYVEYNGAMIRDTKTKENTTSIAIIKEVSDKACFGITKLKANDIIIFDSRKYFSFIYNQPLKYQVITISNDFLKEKKLYKYFSSLVNKKMTDTNFTLYKSLNNIIQNKTINEIDALDILYNIMHEKVPIKPKLTRGEQISILIKDEIYAHVDMNIDIALMAKKHNISQRSLQTNFKAIFGFTPKYFFQLIKLNLAHQDFKNKSIEHTTVLKIANKWGFKHHGRFAEQYTKLFNEHPSTTLKRTMIKEQEIQPECILRKEEMGGGVLLD